MTLTLRYGEQEWVLIEQYSLRWASFEYALGAQCKIIDWKENPRKVEYLFLDELFVYTSWIRQIPITKDITLCRYVLDIPLSKVKNLVRIYRIKLKASHLQPIVSARQLVDFFDIHREILIRLDGTQQWNFLLDQMEIQ